MKFNYALERQKFEQEWAKLQKEYEAAGMPAEDIKTMKEYDWTHMFCAERIVALHTQEIDASIFDQVEDGEQVPESPLMKKFLGVLTTEYDHFGGHSPDWWLDNIEDERLQEWVTTLDVSERRLIDLIMRQGYTQKDCAVIFNISQSAVSQRLTSILCRINKK